MKKKFPGWRFGGVGVVEPWFLVLWRLTHPIVCFGFFFCCIHYIIPIARVYKYDLD